MRWGPVSLLFLAFILAGCTSHAGGPARPVALWGLHLGMTQGLLAAMVASASPENLRGTAFGVFNLAGGLAMLAASGIAGLLWDKMRASTTFYAGVIFSAAALMLVLLSPKPQES